MQLNSHNYWVCMYGCGHKKKANKPQAFTAKKLDAKPRQNQRQQPLTQPRSNSKQSPPAVSAAGPAKNGCASVIVFFAGGGIVIEELIRNLL